MFDNDNRQWDLFETNSWDVHVYLNISIGEKFIFETYNWNAIEHFNHPKI